MKYLQEKYGKWALVTGASSGIGEAFVRYLAAAGMNVILVARRKERLEKLAKEMEASKNIQALAVPLDLSSDDFLEKLKQHVADKEIGMLVNNAGFGSVGLYARNDAQRESEMVKLHCLAPTILTHYFVRPMMERKKGTIIFVGSIVGYQPVPYISTYSATKAFNMFLGKSLWYELRKHHIDALALAPGGTETEFQQVIHQSASAIAAKPDAVVRSAMRALGKKPVVVHGIHNKIWAFSSRFLPVRMSLSLHGWYMRVTTKTDFS